MDAPANFELTRAFSRWREALAAREGLTAERVRELETHLREGVADWRGKGLTEEEAFWIAARRMGDADALAAQFAHADPEGVWRIRIFWMVIGILVIPFMQFLTSLLGMAAIFLCDKYEVPVPGAVVALGASILFIVAMLGLFRGLAVGRWPRLSLVFEAFCTRRRQFAWQLLLLAAVPLMVSLGAIVAFWWLRQHGMAEGIAGRPDWGVMANARIIFFAQSTLWPVALAILAAKYAPLRRLPATEEAM